MEAIVTAERRPDRRVTTFLGLLARESGSRLIVMGGSAISILSEGRYVSADIDVRVGPPGVNPVLKRWGFDREGRHYFRKDLGLFLDVGGTEYTGDPYRMEELQTPQGTIYIAAVEDLIVKRLASAKHWPGPQSQQELEQALTLWQLYANDLDREYLERQAREYHVLDLLTDTVLAARARRHSTRARGPRRSSE